MDELKTINKSIDESIRILQGCEDELYKRIGELSYKCMENPVDEETERLLYVNSMGLAATECLIELARSGVDLLGSHNNKQIAIDTLLSER